MSHRASGEMENMWESECRQTKSQIDNGELRPVEVFQKEQFVEM